MPDRFAIYYAPSTTSELWQRAARWLGRDAATGSQSNDGLPGISAETLSRLTPSATRYGFHATLKAPMRLAAPWTREELEAALAAFASASPAVAIGPLKLALLDGFLALIPVDQSPDLTGFVAEVVDRFEPFRAPLSEAERDKRLKGGLSPRQAELLERFGYPYVMDQFRFHMTLTDRLPADERDVVMAAAESWFAPVLGPDMMLDRLVLYSEPEAGAPFLRDEDYPLTGTPA
jgi:putative phosphonate metabolism protein